MIFKSRKVPKHLIIEDEYEIRQRPRFRLFKLLVLFILVSSLTLILSVAMVVI